MPSLLEDDPNPPAQDGGLFGLPSFDISDALGHVYHSVKKYLTPEQSPLWPLDSPVGTERVGGDVSVGMPDPNVSLARDAPAGGGTRPMTQAEWDAMERGSKTVFGTLAAAEFGDMGPGPRGPVTLASRRVRAPGAGPRPPEPSAQPDAGLLGIRAFHGSPADFNAFSDKFIGTGEGAQAFGRGHYAAEEPSTAASYKGGGFSFQGKRIDPAAGWSPEGSVAGWLEKPKPGETMSDMLARRAQELQDHGDSMAASSDARNRDAAWMYHNAAEKIRAQNPADWSQSGKMYELNIAADPEHMLDWEATLGTHPPAVRDKLYDMGYGATQRGKDVYMHMSRGKEGDAGASARLRDAGIPGIKYLDQGSRTAGEGTYNYAIFDPATIEILRKYGIAGLLAGGGAAAAGTQRQDQ